MIVDADPAGLGAAIEALERGEVVALPTDTLYALAASCRVPGSSARIFALKHRGREVILPVLCADQAQVHSVAVLTGRALELAEEHWPGPLTLVLARRPGFDADLGDDRATVGVRISDDETTRVVAASVGPLATSSANLHGETEPPTPEAIANLFGDGLAVIVRRGTADPGSPTASTVLRCNAKGNILEVLRQGAIVVEVGG